MKINKNIFLILLGGFLIMAVAPTYLFFSQNKSIEKTKKLPGSTSDFGSPGSAQTPEDIKAALLRVGEDGIGSVLLDRVIATEHNWSLNYTKHSVITDNYVSIEFKNRSEEMTVMIDNVKTVEEADSRLNMPVSLGGNISFRKVGDGGGKYYGPLTGKQNVFYMLEYRIGTFLVIIRTRNEKAAERFAVYAAEAIRSRANQKPAAAPALFKARPVTGQSKSGLIFGHRPR